MKIVKKSNEIKTILKKYQSYGFVPTMGALHEGHKSLIRKCKKQNKITVVSIFLNPKQFTNKEDLKKYPSNIKKDISICKSLKVDFLFIPSFKEVYSFKTKKLKYPIITNIMEAKYRPGHFIGVIKVIDKLVSIVPAKKMYLGEKDYQQIKVISDYLKINKKNIKIIKCNTIRYKSGLAISSRNKRLNNKGLFNASKIINFVKKFKKNNQNKIFNQKKLKNLLDSKKIKYDYIENINFKKFIRSNKISKNTKLFIAYYVNNIRLIDNI